MGRKKSTSKSQATFVDEEASLFVIENQEFMAMRAAQKIWPAPTTTDLYFETARLDRLRDYF